MIKIKENQNFGMAAIFNPPPLGGGKASIG